jgi:pimeloyl-ACP methyl ester carboxylesterase
MSRLIFIHGLGEEPGIFDAIAPALPGEKIFIDNWKEIGAEDNAWQYAQSLVQRYVVKPDDVVIGHSLGGWVGIHMKQHSGCRVIQLASWTNPHKIIRPFGLPDSLSLWLARNGLYFSTVVRGIIERKQYRGKPSRDLFISTFDRLMNSERSRVVAQLRILLNPTGHPLTVAPDLRVHARGDTLVRIPDEPFAEVPGDHFMLMTFPEAVIRAILATLVSPRWA